MENKPRDSIALLSEADWQDAQQKYNAIRPFLDEGVQLTKLARAQGLPIRTLTRWVEKFRSKGIAGLVKAVRTRRGIRASATLQNLIEGLALKSPRLSIAAIYRYLKTHEVDIGEPIPSYSSIYRIVQLINPSLLTLAHDGRQAYADKYDLVHRTEAEMSNAIWQADHTVLDVLIKHKGHLKKPWLTIILDDYSRSVAGYSLSFSAPSAIQTALAFRQAIWHKSRSDWEICGIPDIFYTDHGSDFTSFHIEQLAVSIKTLLIFSAVGQPRGRGKIERFFRSLSQVLLPHLPGHQPPGSKSKSKKFMTLSQLASRLEEYIVNDYHLKAHGTTRTPPKLKWASNNFLPRLPRSLAELDLLLLTVPKNRVVHNDGIRFEGFRYIHPALAGYVGEGVTVRYDPRDMAEVSIFHGTAFVCRAVCTDLAGETVALSEIASARRSERQSLQAKIKDRARSVESLLSLRTDFGADDTTHEDNPPPPKASSKLKRYYNE